MTPKNDERSLLMFVANCLADDVESVESVLSLLNKPGNDGFTLEWGRCFAREEVEGGLRRLIRLGWAVPYSPLGPEGRLSPMDKAAIFGMHCIDSLWFGLTEEGRRHHNIWAQTQARE